MLALIGAGPIPDPLTRPRPDGSPADADAVHWIETQLADMGATVEREPVGFVDLPEVSVMGQLVRSARLAEAKQPNLVVRFGATRGKALLVMAHHDSVATSPGAADNAAAVVVLLDLARDLVAHPPAQPVIIAFTAAEEDGLVGAEALAAELGDEVAFAIALDLIGGDGQLVVNGASTQIGRRELAWLLDAAARADVDLGVPAVHRVVSRRWPQAERSDHGPFTRRGVRAIHLYNRGNDGEWIDLAYHSERDTPARLHPEHIAEVGRLLRALVAVPPPPHDGDGFVVPGTRIVIARWILVAVELLLALVAIAVLVRTLAASLTRAREPVRGAALLAGAARYALAVGAAVACGDALWILRPTRALVASALVIAGVGGLLSRIVTRVAPWRGEARYHAVATGVLLAIGLACVAAGAAELAWAWLVPAAVLAVARHVRWLTWPAVAVTALPALLALYPLRLREAVWNGFLPPGTPVAVLVGLVGLPAAAAVAWGLRRRGAAGPLGPLVLGVGCALLAAAGLAVALTAPDPCSTADFMKFSLACERV